MANTTKRIIARASWIKLTPSHFFAVDNNWIIDQSSKNLFINEMNGRSFLTERIASRQSIGNEIVADTQKIES